MMKACHTKRSGSVLLRHRVYNVIHTPSHDIHFILYIHFILSYCNFVLRILLQIKIGYISSLLAKYNVPLLSVPQHRIKSCAWNTFVIKTMNAGHVTPSQW